MLRSHSAAEPQLNEVGFDEPAVWSQELSFVRKTSSWLAASERGRIFDMALLLRGSICSCWVRKPRDAAGTYSWSNLPRRSRRSTRISSCSIVRATAARVGWGGLRPDAR
jgi:hypothetical protein